MAWGADRDGGTEMGWGSVPAPRRPGRLHRTRPRPPLFIRPRPRGSAPLRPRSFLEPAGPAPSPPRPVSRSPPRPDAAGLGVVPLAHPASPRVGIAPPKNGGVGGTGHGDLAFYPRSPWGSQNPAGQTSPDIAQPLLSHPGGAGADGASPPHPRTQWGLRGTPPPSSFTPGPAATSAAATGETEARGKQTEAQGKLRHGGN